MPYARVLMQFWSWGNFRDKQHEKNPVNNALVAFSSFSAQQLTSLTITIIARFMFVYNLLAAANFDKF